MWLSARVLAASQRSKQFMLQNVIGSHLLAAAAEAARVIEQRVFVLISWEVRINGGQALQGGGAAATAAGRGAGGGPAGQALVSESDIA